MEFALFMIILAVITVAIIVARIVLVPREEQKRRRERDADRRSPASRRWVGAWPPRDRQERPVGPEQRRGGRSQQG